MIIYIYISIGDVFCNKVAILIIYVWCVLLSLKTNNFSVWLVWNLDICSGILHLFRDKKVINIFGLIMGWIIDIQYKLFSSSNKR